MKKSKFYIYFFGIIGIILATIGVTYAFFTYQKDGTKNVTMTSGSVKLHYQESSLKNINLTNALPMDDERGKSQTDYFEFTITGETAGYDIPYIVTSRVTTNEEDQIPANYISLYLTEIVDNNEVEVLDTTYDRLTNLSKNNHIEQQLMLNKVSANISNYEKTYRLRMWINEDADYSPTEVGGEQTYPLQNKEFFFIVNIYTEVDEYIQPVNRLDPGLYTMDDILIEDWNELLVRGLVEPDLSNGKTIVEETLFDHNIEIGKLVLADTITEIAEEAFKDCSNLGGIVMTDNVKKINSLAFSNSGLQDIVFPKLLDLLDSESFSNCNNLQDIHIYEVNELGSNIFADCTNIDTIEIDKLGSLNNNLFNSNSIANTLIIRDGNISTLTTGNITNFYIYSGTTNIIALPTLEYFYGGNDVTKIGNVYSCSSLKKVEIHGGEIVQNAFGNNCIKLEDIYIGSNVSKIKSSAFQNCIGLKNLTIEEGVTEIGNRAFGNIGSVNNVIIPGSVETIEQYLFQYSGVKSITLSEGVKVIRNNAFDNCSYLESIQFPTTLTSIEEYAFNYSGIEEVNISANNITVSNHGLSDMSELKRVTFTGTNVKIGNYNFYYDDNLEYAEFNDAEIGSSALSSRTKLETFKINSGSLGEHALDGCTSLTNVELGNIDYIGSYAFASCTSLESITLPSSLNTLKNESFNGSNNLVSITFENTNNWYENDNLIDVTNPTLNATRLINGQEYDWERR